LWIYDDENYYDDDDDDYDDDDVMRCLNLVPLLKEFPHVIIICVNNESPCLEFRNARVFDFAYDAKNFVYICILLVYYQ
jgi:hypothetical protein